MSLWIFETKKRPLLDTIQYTINVFKKNDKTIHRIRVDEDGALAKSYDLNCLLAANNLIMETKTGHDSK